MAPHSLRPTLRFLPCFLALSLLSLSAGATTLVDQNGRTVTLPQRVERVATLVIPAASMVMALDQDARRLVAMHPTSRDEVSHGLLGKMFPGAQGIPANIARDGFVPNVEALLAQKPDLVIQWGDKGEALIAPLTRAGLPVLTLRYGDSALAAEWLRLTGHGLLDRGGRGERLAREFLATREAIARQTETIPPGRRPRVLYLYRAQGNAYQVAGRQTSMDADIQLCGGINVAHDQPGFAQVSAEQILAWAPDVILLNNFEKDSRPARFMAQAVLATLPAVRARRVYVYPQGGFRWDPPSQESPLSWRWLLTLFHPDLAQPPLRQEILRAYADLYAYHPTSGELDTLLRLSENGESRYYREKFGNPTP